MNLVELPINAIEHHVNFVQLHTNLRLTPALFLITQQLGLLISGGQYYRLNEIFRISKKNSFFSYQKRILIKNFTKQNYKFSPTPRIKILIHVFTKIFNKYFPGKKPAGKRAKELKS